MFLLNSKAAARILLKKWNGVFVLSIFMAIIFLPCFVESGFSFGFQNKGEVIDGSFMFRKGIPKKSGEIVFNDGMSWIEGNDFVFEGFSELGASNSSINFISVGNGETVSYPYTKKGRDAGYSQYGKNRTHHYLHILIGGIFDNLFTFLILLALSVFYYKRTFSYFLTALGFETLGDYFYKHKPNAANQRLLAVRCISLLCGFYY